MTEPPDRRSRHRHPAVLLAVLSTATFMTTLDVFIVNVGLRPIGAALHHSSLADLSWILNAYAIVFAALLVPAGRLADRYGVKGTFLFGLAVFGAGSLGAALCGNVWLLVLLRCVQAVGAAAIMPTSLALILNGMPRERIARSIQVWAISGSLGASAGPTLGGLLVEASWRWIFIVNVPIALAALGMAMRTAPDPRHSTETRIPDLLGGAFLMTGIGALTLALVQGPAWGWGSGSIVGAFMVAALALAAAVLRSALASSPVIDLTLFRDRTFTWANIGAFMLSLAFGLQLLGLVFWMQEGWGWSAIRTGLAISPGPVMVSVTSLGLRRYTSKLPAGLVAAIGGIALGTGAVLIGTSLGARPDYAEVLPGWILCGAGVGLWTPTLVGAATSGLARHQTSTGSAVVQMNRQIGLTLGVAVLVVVIGSSRIDRAALDRFTQAWWWSAALSLAGAFTCLPLLRRSDAARSESAPAPATAAGQVPAKP
ncbi:MFS transporter [Actinacidiphila acididurans]|uniref:MFS transporter n=1 Tax=Actinacidiphila acididurans TaxID=2784346 RepID=A0ABS2TIC2_9ACTN|nr:MFS transporter [Actinacidiphila acididurans]MBM9503088.1 MFS transporter [Actinacidiphila acididurans]